LGVEHDRSKLSGVMAYPAICKQGRLFHTAYILHTIRFPFPRLLA